MPKKKPSQKPKAYIRNEEGILTHTLSQKIKKLQLNEESLLFRPTDPIPIERMSVEHSVDSIRQMAFTKIRTNKKRSLSYYVLNKGMLQALR